MRTFTSVVVGGGASGIVSAIGAGRAGSSVVICEKTPRLGKKILASGNGRCNLSNDNLGISSYNAAARPLVSSVFKRVGKEAINAFFTGLGLQLHSEDGRIFPVTNQSASVLKVLEMELSRLKIPVELSFDVSSITASGDGFVVAARSGDAIAAKTVILATGGRSYPSFGSDGSGYRLAENFGHTLIAPVPVAVPLVVKDPLCHLLQGQKIQANIKSVINGTQAQEISGDLLFTKYGLSGTAILDVSESVSVAFNRTHIKNIELHIDMVPFMEEKTLARELARRLGDKCSPEELTIGILPNKFGHALKGLLGSNDPVVIAKSLKNRVFKVLETRGWNEAEFTAGGVNVSEVNCATLESRLRKGLYLSGEILDVNGARGGFNLAWAWAAGLIAGESAAHA